MDIELRVMQVARSFDFEITRMISDQIALHSVQLHSLSNLILHDMDSASFQFFTGVSNHMNVTKLASRGWMILFIKKAKRSPIIDLTNLFLPFTGCNLYVLTY